MPANSRQPASQPPASPNAKATARYTNKDGSKIITVPKGLSSAEASQPSTPIPKDPVPEPPAGPGANGPAQPVNRKKQKRRAKAAAKAAQQAASAVEGEPSPSSETPQGPDLATPREQAEADLTDDERDDHGGSLAGTNGVMESKSKKNKKKKKKNANAAAADLHEPEFAELAESSSHPAAEARGSGISKEKIWNTSSQEERERIKEFWLGLGEEDRKSLVKVEKDAVLKKMKEQQKHTCSCTVCGRKRIAIEEELEGLYDAYYEELEQFANQSDGPPLPRDFPVRSSRLPSTYARQAPSRGRIVEHVGDDEDDAELEEYSEEELEEDDEYSVDEPPEDVHPDDRDVADFLAFGNSLQVKGGILTVADDLLKNDGKRFIEMMEQLAERRMAREEDAREHLSRGYGHPTNGSYAGHNHPPPAEDEYDDDDEEEEEEEYDDSQDEDYEDEEDTMTEEQRMEEGRRMFQIFAARMFEQRVLTAYRDMVAQQRQNKLLEELDEEQRQDAQRKAKKAKDAQKRKDKAALKRQAQAEEKARKEAEKAAEEAARLEEQQQRAEEQRLRAEEKRRKKEEQRRIEVEERARKETERQKRLHEQQERRAEQERKAREAKEKERKLKEEARLREKEAREQREKELREKRESQEREKREREAKAKAEWEAKELADREGKERAREERAAQKAPTPAAAASAPGQTARRPSQQPQPVPVPTVLPHHPPNPASYASPKIPVATPALPKAPTPARPRTGAQSQEASATPSRASQSSQNASPHSSTPAHPSPHPFTLQRKGSNMPAVPGPHPHATSQPEAKGPSGPAGHFGIPPGMGHPPGFPMPPPGLSHRGMPHDPMFGSMDYGRPPPGMMPGPPGLNGPGGRGFPPPPPPGFSPSFGEPIPPAGPSPASHSRQPSGGFESSPLSSSQPIGRPAPIGRPGSIVHGQGLDHGDDASNQHLGSSALLDDSEEPAGSAGARQRNQAPGPRQAFPGTPFGMDSNLGFQSELWRNPPPFASFGPPPGLGAPTWGSPLASIPPMPNLAQIRSAGNPRTVAVRLMLCQACKELQGHGAEGNDGFIDLDLVTNQVEELNRLEGVSREAIAETELLDLAETEGTPQNGGGVFDIRRDAKGSGKHTIRWVPDLGGDASQPLRAVGEIGSPIIGASSTATAAFPARGS